MIGEALRAGLKREGFAVDWVHDAEAAAAVLRTEPFELLLLDLGLPGRDGLQLLKELRGRGVTPVLMNLAFTDRYRETWRKANGERPGLGDQLFSCKKTRWNAAAGEFFGGRINIRFLSSGG